MLVLHHPPSNLGVASVPGPQTRPCLKPPCPQGSRVREHAHIKELLGQKDLEERVLGSTHELRSGNLRVVCPGSGVGIRSSTGAGTNDSSSGISPTKNGAWAARAKSSPGLPPGSKLKPRSPHVTSKFRVLVGVRGVGTLGRFNDLPPDVAPPWPLQPRTALRASARPANDARSRSGADGVSVTHAARSLAPDSADGGLCVRSEGRHPCAWDAPSSSP